MKILHTISGMGAKDGGTSSCSYALLNGLREEGLDVEVLCYEPVAGDVLVGQDNFIKTVPIVGRNKFLYSKKYKKALVQTSNIGLYHLNGLWEYPTILSAIIARKKNRAYIISPHGMLYPQALKTNKWLKKIMLHFFLKKDLQKANLIHATCAEEMVYLRQLGVTTPIAIIPNAIELDDLLKKAIQPQSIRKFGYLGRVHPRKKIETLLYVWAQLENKVDDAELVIIGSGDDDYIDFLQQECQRLQLKNVVFAGFLTGDAKDEMVSSLSYLAVPSDFENFGMIVVEALALGIPVIASKGTPWQELETNNCGWWITNTVDSFCEIFEKALQLPESERLLMAENGRKLVLEKYDSRIVSKKMGQLYDWVLDPKEKPDFVYLNGELPPSNSQLDSVSKKLTITHCISSIDISTGGPARSVVGLVESLGELSAVLKVNLLTIQSDNPLIRQFLNTKLLLKSHKSSRFKYSSEFYNKLKMIPAELFHLHGIWEVPGHLMINIATKRNLPYIVSVRGMLEPWSLKQSRWKKKLAMFLFQKKDLQKASCLHATGQMEVESIRKLGYTNPIAVIPNGINCEEYPQKQYLVTKNKKTILLLSRIHPKKGIKLLIEAWELLDSDLKKNWCIKIAGNGNKTYIEELHTLIQKKGLSENITIIGPQFGSEKIAAYHSADLFVLPTYSENFGNVIAEALSCGVPVITTQGTPWQDLEKYKAGRWIAIGVFPLKEALEEFMVKTNQELQIMGENGRKLIVEKYAIASVAARFVQLYQWILFGGEKPDFVNE